MEKSTKGWLSLVSGLLLTSAQSTIASGKPSGWMFLGLLLAGLGGTILHKAPAPSPGGSLLSRIGSFVLGLLGKSSSSADDLEPTDSLDVEDGGAALGKASGEAAAAASKGPFKKIAVAAPAPIATPSPAASVAAASAPAPASPAPSSGK